MQGVITDSLYHAGGITDSLSHAGCYNIFVIPYTLVSQDPSHLGASLDSRDVSSPCPLVPPSLTPSCALFPLPPIAACFALPLPEPALPSHSPVHLPHSFAPFPPPPLGLGGQRRGQFQLRRPLGVGSWRCAGCFLVCLSKTQEKAIASPASGLSTLGKRCVHFIVNRRISSL